MGPHATHAVYVLEPNWSMVTYDANLSLIHGTFWILCVICWSQTHAAWCTPDRWITYKPG